MKQHWRPHALTSDEAKAREARPFVAHLFAADFPQRYAAFREQRLGTLIDFLGGSMSHAEAGVLFDSLFVMVLLEHAGRLGHHGYDLGLDVVERIFTGKDGAREFELLLDVARAVFASPRPDCEPATATPSSRQERLLARSA